MQLSFDSRGSSVPTILLMMRRHLYARGRMQAEGIFRITAENSEEEYVREQLNAGVVPDDVDVHCLAGLIKAWFRELPNGLLDSIPPEEVTQAVLEEDCAKLVRCLRPTEAALLDWAINLMADVAQLEHLNKMNARNVAMVFAPNMTQVDAELKLPNEIQVTVNGSSVIADIEYQWIPDICTECKVFGHLKGKCTKVSAPKPSGKKEIWQVVGKGKDGAQQTLASSSSVKAVQNGPMSETRITAAISAQSSIIKDYDPIAHLIDPELEYKEPPDIRLKNEADSESPTTLDAGDIEFLRDVIPAFGGSKKKALAGLLFRRSEMGRVFDAKGQVLGRLASQISTMIQGKDKPTYAPNHDEGDMCIVLDSQDICVTGRKLTTSGFPTLDFYEATIGAGLQIISTLQGLLETGDEILRIDGIFRKSGLKLELSDIPVQILVQEPLLVCASAEEYLQQLSQYDHDMSKECAEIYWGGGHCESKRGSRIGNIIVFTTERCMQQIVHGLGSGVQVTAGGIFSDLIWLALYLGAPS
ncbi:hypothetical protein Vadar_033123 [Vaccinium darrowii]|uniref:Uncharacterized protein n=1 Tax=Vaccinium darrowii TaxID=229202 RepID=A0ACB7XVU6_9ERIC|nr:hypothetical protein Vadar_033123 [Vaccinium darrowii]